MPQGANRSTLNVIVDAGSQTVVKVFPATDTGDAAITAYLNGKQVPDDSDFDGDDGADRTAAPSPSAGPTGPVGDEDTVSTLRRLRERNREVQKELREQEADLERLLDAQP